MDITVRDASDNEPVAILKLSGELDASNYLDVIQQVQDIYTSGSRRLVIDMSDVTFLSSSGLVALHSAALIMRGDQPPDPEAGWTAYHAIASDVEGGFESCCNLYNAQGRARKTLELTGFSDFLEIHDDLDQAVNALAQN